MTFSYGGGQGPAASRYFISNDWTTLRSFTRGNPKEHKAVKPMTAAEVAKFGVGSNDLTLVVHGKTAEKVHESKREQSRRASTRKEKQLETLSSGVTRA